MAKKVAASKKSSKVKSQTKKSVSKKPKTIKNTAPKNQSKQKKIIQPFHLAFPCNSISEARAFYGGILGCKEGRSTDIWCDFNFFGHQVVAHKVSDSYRGDANPMGNPVDGHGVPVPHFGLVMEWNQFSKLAA